MNSAAARIGRIGSLAVALGIGAAVSTGAGVAWADTSDGETASHTSAEQDSSESSAPVRRGGKPSKPSIGQKKPRPGPAAAVQRPSVTVRQPATSLERQSFSPPTPLSAQAPGAAAAAPSTAAPAPAAVSNATRFAAPAAVGTVTPAPVVAPPATLAAPRGISRLLSAKGLASLGGTTLPGLPADSPALWALLGWTRRDAGRTGVRLAAAQSALPGAPTAALVTAPNSLPSTPIGWVTGQRNTAYPGAGWTQTNNTSWANVYGTDLGIMWFNGVNGRTQLAFGDTFSGPNMTGNWRSNVLLLSKDTNLSDGLSLIETGPAYQFIPAARNEVFILGSEVTNIPTSALYANNNNYVNYMSVKSWDTPGRWTTNYSAVSQYDPATDKWVLQTKTIRPAAFFRTWTPYQAGDQNFQQMAYVLQPADKVAPGATRYVYAFGTPSGRAGSAYLSRVPEADVTNLRKYEYWNGTKWIGNQARAVAVLGDSDRSPGLFGWAIDLANNPNVLGGIMAGFTGAKTGGNISEMSVQYNDHLDKYVVLYGNGANNVILRTADTPEGPWSDPVTIATSAQYPGLYAPMIHPLSGTGALTDSSGNPDVANLYWNMSLWGNYNVVLMKTDLSPLAGV